MAIFFAYLMVVLIWATTPLAIQWSADSLSFVAAVLARMLCALGLALVVALIYRNSFMPFWRDAKIHFAASIGIFPNMLVVYWAAQFIPSGLVAVIFSLSPFAIGAMTLLLLKQNPFSIQRVVALLLAVFGLVVIFYHQMQLMPNAVYGIGGILLSCLLFSFSTVWVKKLTLEKNISIKVFDQAVGALLFSLPGLLVSWWLIDGVVPENISLKSAGAIIYLAVIGSLVGMALFFYVLQRLSASLVSLITLMTPVLAIMLGKALANEELSLQTLLGASIVLFALLIYLPWSVRDVVDAVNRMLMRRLRAHETIEIEDPSHLLQQIRDDAARYK